MIQSELVAEVLAAPADPGEWRLVCSALAAEVVPVDCAVHLEWARRNCHAHAHQEVFALLEGEGHEWFLDQVYPTAPGTFFVFDSFEPHEFGRPPWAPDARELWVHPLHDHVVVAIQRVVDGRLSAPDRLVCPLTWEEVGLAPGRRFAPEPAQAQAAPGAARLRLIGAIAAVLSAVVLRGYATGERDDATLPERVVEAICTHLRTTAGKGATIDQLARIAGYSPFHFVRLFKQHTGMTVHDYINLSRMQRVEEMQGWGAQQQQIAEALGFSSPATYSRWYHRTYRVRRA